VEVYQELEEIMDSHWSLLHNQRFGKDQRIDVKSPLKTYRTIIQEYYLPKYTNYDLFIRESFHPFCVGYLSINDENVIAQRYPIAWAIRNNRYSHYRDLGKQILDTEIYQRQELEDCIYDVTDISELSSSDVLHSAHGKYWDILHLAKKHVSESIHTFYFSEDVISFVGVELSFRILVKCPWPKNSPLRGEFYRHLYRSILPEYQENISIKLI